MRIVFFIFILCLSIRVFAGDESCTRTQEGLTGLFDGQPFTPKWIETTADDGKPLKIEMSKRDDALYFVFDKTDEGIWAEGVVEVCKEKKGFIVRIAKKDIKLGDKAPRLIRWTMGGGAKFHMKFKDGANMHLSTFGWSGDFVPQTAKLAL